jgi:hypothetical protein
MAEKKGQYPFTPQEIRRISRILVDSDSEGSLIFSVPEDSFSILSTFYKHAQPTLEWVDSGRGTRQNVCREFNTIIKEVSGAREVLQNLAKVTAASFIKTPKNIGKIGRN